MATKMSKISACEVTDCSYNKGRQCHALAITVGGPEACACCDTYLHKPGKGGTADVSAGVGACKVDDCKFNMSLECSAPDIKVGLHHGHADCKTFSMK